MSCATCEREGKPTETVGAKCARDQACGWTGEVEVHRHPESDRWGLADDLRLYERCPDCGCHLVPA